MLQASPSAVPFPSPGSVELDAALLQTVVTLGLAGFAALLYRRYRKAHFAWFAITWSLYVLRLAAITAFLLSQARIWLYWHQVVTGWTALAMLWAALVVSRALVFRKPYLAVLLFPLGWSYVAIYVLDNFLYAALPAVLFLSIVTAITAAVFFQHWRRVREPGAGFLAGALFLWALHHLDYPFLRARGAWSPWGYYLDIVFLLATGVGLSLLVLDELRLGFGALTALAGVASERGHAGDPHALLEAALALPATRGAALFTRVDQTGESKPHGVSFVLGVGECASWAGRPLSDTVHALIAAALESARPRSHERWHEALDSGSDRRSFLYAAAIPIPRTMEPTAALVLVGDARNPFGALDDGFLIALGQQIGSAMDGAELTRRLEARTTELTRLSARMIEQHEEERRRLSLELHDETAQVFSAVKLQLGLLREGATGGLADSLARAVSLVDEGMRSIRNVTETLRPTVLDDLGLVPALRSLAASFEQRCGLRVELEAPHDLPRCSDETELALFRAMQEALSNSARHAGASCIWVELSADATRIRLVIRDNGRGGPGAASGEHVDPDRLQRGGHMGLAGMRERIIALGGQWSIDRAPEGGLRLTMQVERAAGASG